MFLKSLDLAVKLGLIQFNVAKKVGNVKKERKSIEFWTKDEFQDFMSTFDLNDYFEQYSYTIIYFLFMTGIRFGELQALTWSDLDFENELVNINKSMYYTNPNNFKINPPKTKAGNRII